MRIFYHILVLILFISPVLQFSCLAQNGNYQVGARATGMADASVTLDDPYSIFNNVGGITGVENTSLLFFYQNRYQLSEFNTFGAGIIQPFAFGTLGLSLFRFGNSLYTEQKLGLSFGNKFGIASLGAQINYLQLNVEGFGNKGLLVLEFGGIAKLTPQLFIGAHIFNINQAKVSSAFDEKVPTVIKAGVSYRPFSKLMLNIETEKDIDFDPVFKAGLEYLIIDQVSFRTGITADPFQNFWGLGFKAKYVIIDYSFSIDSDLGNIHQLSVVYQLKKRES